MYVSLNVNGVDHIGRHSIPILGYEFVIDEDMVSAITAFDGQMEASTRHKIGVDLISFFAIPLSFHPWVSAYHMMTANTGKAWIQMECNGGMGPNAVATLKVHIKRVRQQLYFPVNMQTSSDAKFFT